jgi:hypothetical protein
MIMIKYGRAALAAGLLISAVGFVGRASAADPDFCHDYADQALRQTHIARESPACADYFARDPARWTMDYDAHYGWCLRKHPKEVDRERNARMEILDRCVNHDWRDEDHRSRDHDDDHRGDDERHW